ncbi:MAG: glycosyltransferase family 2 protein [Acidimicrobiales bacterium]|nr:glycosyltransferase family 2 protein [Acidimicrobiales bacterium]
MQPASDSPEQALSDLPRVRIVLPVHEPSPLFDETIQSIQDQDYPHLALTIVHETAAAGPLARHVEAYPNIDVARVPDGLGFGARLNLAIADIDEPLLIICHDDIAFSPDTVSTLVREFMRRGDEATLVAPKLLDWSDPVKLAPAGFDADRFGETAAMVRGGDLDQGQQERVSDVFGVSTACVLLARSFLDTLGGFDEAIDWHGEAHDLSLRARLCGGKVILASAASARHRGDFEQRGGASTDLRRRRHQMRSVLGSAPPASALVSLVGFIGLHIIEFVVAVARLDLVEVRSIPAAWLWNIGHVRSLIQRRQQISRHVELDGAELRKLRRRGSIRLSESADRRVQEREEAADRGESSLTVVRGLGAVAIGSILLFGARHLLTRSIPVVGEFRAVPDDWGTLSADWWSGWRPWGMGVEAWAPFAHPLLDVGGFLTFGSAGLLRMLLIVLPLPIGVIGAWRLFERTESPRAPVVAAALYAASPVPYNALATGSMQAMLLYASAPWLLSHLVRIPKLTVFGSSRSRRASVVGLVTLLAVVGAFVPIVFVVFGLVVVGLIAGSFLAGDMRGMATLLGVSAVAAAIGAALNAPYLWSLRHWSQVGAGIDGAGLDFTLPELLTSATGPVGSVTLGAAVFAPALFPLLSGHGQRFTWALRVWGVVLAFWAVAWAGSQGWLDIGLPAAEVLLVPVALGLAMLGGLSVMVYDHDLRDATARQLVPAVLATLGFGIALLPLLDGSFTGRWELPRVDLATSLGAVERPAEEGSYRVVWIGDPHVLGASGIPTSSNLAWTSSLDGSQDIRAAWGGESGLATELLGEAIGAGIDGRTSRLGRELSRFGVRYLVILDRQVPLPEPGRAELASSVQADGFAAQLDLVRSGVVNPAVVVYENTAWAPLNSAVSPAALETLRVDDAAPAVVFRTSHDEWTGQVRAGRSVYSALEPSSRWSLTIDDQVRPRVDVGPVGMAFDGLTDSEVTAASLVYETNDIHRLVLGAQTFAWLAMAFLRRWIVGRERRLNRAAERSVRA